MVWVLSGIVGVLLGLGVLFRMFRKRIFAAMCTRFAKERLFTNEKTDLFKRLNQQIGKSKQTLKVLEIGGGSGSNFAFVDSLVDWTVTEPNLHFEPYFIENSKPYREKHNIGNLVEAYGEDLGQFESESFDAVIVTLVLCSVKDIQATFREIRRVLKPGGIFYFMEHIRAPSSDRRMQIFQDFISNTGIWPGLFDGCYLNRETKEDLKKGGFSKLEMVDTTFDFRLWLFLYQNMNPYAVYRWATK